MPTITGSTLARFLKPVLTPPERTDAEVGGRRFAAEFVIPRRFRRATARTSGRPGGTSTLALVRPTAAA